jgi:serine/threonine-protein kinase
MSSEPTARSDRKVLVGRYEIRQRVGAGGMGTVYRAVHLDLGREVALKVLPPDLAAQPEMLRRFKHEAQHAARLRHDNIVTLYEIGEASGTHFLAMEFIEGINLHEHIERQGRLDPEEARMLTIQAARALAAAQEQNIVHRDIKPSNFLLTQRDGRPFVKLTDFGLARNIDSADFKVTKTGTTVGTVDYIAPEQARNSHAADVRSDIYALGCTLYHMLAGAPPFPEGDMTERLLRHLEVVPADIRQHNPKVPPGLAVVLKRMLEKKPADRYQTPAELLKDLEHLPSGGPPLTPRELLEALAQSAEEKPRKKPTSAAGRTTRPEIEMTQPIGPVPPSGPLPRLRYRKSDAPLPRERPNRPRPTPVASRSGAPLVIEGWKPWIIIGAIVLVVGSVGLALALGVGAGNLNKSPLVATSPPPDTGPDPADRSRQANTDKAKPPPDPPKPGPEPPVDPAGKPPVKPGGDPAQRPPIAPQAELPPVFQPPPEVVASLGQEFAGLRPMPPGPASPPPVNPVPGQSGPKTASDIRVVSRWHVNEKNGSYASLAAACAAAPAGQTTIIEIQDNGPLIEPAVAVSGRSLVVRAGKGYRPLIAWKLPAAEADFFLSVAQGNLTLQDLDLVVKCSDAGVADLSGFIRLTGGQMHAEGCTMSVAGRQRSPFAVVKLEENAGVPCSCRLDRCYLRGAEVTALAVQAAPAQVVLDGCLLAGGDRPLLDLAGKRSAVATTVRIARSTLVAGQNLARVRPAGTGDKEPNVEWVFWDTLLARFGNPGGGKLLALDEGAGRANMKWRAVNCLYAGWQMLLSHGATSLSPGELSDWRKLWNYDQGDAVADQTWPALLPPDPCDTPAAAFRASGTHAGYASSSGKGALGCDVALLPAARETWQWQTYDRFVPPPLETPAADQVPDIPPSADGAYAGETLNLADVNLGVHLAEVQQKHRLAPRVVLHLTGKGEVRTNPIHIKGSTLVLYFPPYRTEAERLVLAPRNAGDRDALIEVEDAGCELINGGIQFDEVRNLSMPAYLLKVHGGDLRLTNCRLQGPLGQVPQDYRGLIHFQGSGETALTRARECIVATSVLLSGRIGLHALGAGTRVRLQQCVVVAGTDAFRLDPSPTAGARLNAQCLLEHNTVAARQAVVRLGDASTWAPPVEPILVQAHENLFQNPFAAGPSAPGMLVGEGEALDHGLLIWQGDGNGYDNRLQDAAPPGGLQAGSTPWRYAAWKELWGPNGDRRPVACAMPARSLDLNSPDLSCLALPESRPKSRTPSPGADLEQLGITVKGSKKVKSP